MSKGMNQMMAWSIAVLLSAIIFTVGIYLVLRHAKTYESKRQMVYSDEIDAAPSTEGQVIKAEDPATKSGKSEERIPKARKDHYEKEDSKPTYDKNDHGWQRSKTPILAQSQKKNGATVE